MPADDHGSSGSRLAVTKLQLQIWAPGVALIALYVGFALADPGFATLENLRTIADRAAIPLILAVGATFIILQGSIDLSIEGIMGVCSLTFAIVVLNSRTGLDLGLFGLVLASLAGAGVGVLSGLLITSMRVPSFMVTLGVQSACLGIAMLLSSDQPPRIMDPMLRAIGLGRSLAVSNLFFIAVAVVLLGHILQSYTRFGRYSMIIGGGEEQARLLGVAVDRYKVFAFGFGGLLSGLAGALESARIGIGHVYIGSGQMFATVTAVVVGGTLLSGGRGGVLRSVVGTLALAVLTSGMIFIGISPYIQKTVEGALILLTTFVTMWPLRDRLRIVK